MAKAKAEQQTSLPPLIQALYEARGDRATLAKLRRGLGKQVGEPGAAERDGWVLQCLPTEVSRTQLNDLCLIASLFGLHPQSDGRGTLGAAFRQLWKENDEADGPERRFVALLNSDPADLPTRLRHAVSLLKGNEIAIDWARLLTDLRKWNRPERFVQRRWARDFWGAWHVQDDEAEHDAR